MVRLVSIIHGCTVYSLLEKTELSCSPSQGLVSFLSELPKGSRVGIEETSPEEWKEVERNMRRLAKARLPKKSSPLYLEESRRYWKDLAEECLKLGLEVVYLENKEAWFRFNAAKINEARFAIKGEDELIKKEDESDFGYTAKLCWFNDQRYRLEIASRKIHELDRDDDLLKKIKESGVDVAAVGLGHGDYWWGIRDSLLELGGINFESYFTDTPDDSSINPFLDVLRSPRMVFTQNASCNPRMCFDRERLEREIRVVEQSRVTNNGVPDFVGTWDYLFPSKGYFEVFVHEREGSRVSGQIQDVLGVATFEGDFNEEVVQFTKKYTLASTMEARNPEYAALSCPVFYKGVRVDNGFGGIYFAERSRSPFYMSRPLGRQPLDLSLRFLKHEADIVERLQDLGLLSK